MLTLKKISCHILRSGHDFPFEHLLSNKMTQQTALSFVQFKQQKA